MSSVSSTVNLFALEDHTSIHSKESLTDDNIVPHILRSSSINNPVPTSENIYRNTIDMEVNHEYTNNNMKTSFKGKDKSVRKNQTKCSGTAPVIYNFNQRKESLLQKTLTSLAGMSMIVGSVIGSGIFSPSYVLKDTGSVGLFLIVWLICGIIALLAGMSYIELGTAIPKSGAEYSYILEGFGKIPAFLFSWTSTLVIRPSACAIISIVFAQYIITPFYVDTEIPEMLKKGIAIGCVVLITLVNCISVRWAVFVQNVFTTAKLIGVFILIVIGFIELGKGNFSNFKDAFNGTETNVFKISEGFYSGLWAYDGWNTLNFVTEEMRNPSKDMPHTLILSIVIVTVCYLLCNIAYVAVLGASGIATSSTVALDVANKYLGQASFIMPVLVALSCFGAVNGLAFSSGRLVYAAARESHLPKVLSLVQVKRHTPIPSLIFTAIISIIMLIPDASTFERLINFFSFASWVFYGACFFVLLFLRFKRKTMIRTYKVFLPIPIVMVLVSIFLIVFPFYQDVEGSAIALGIILCGIPVYFIFVWLDVLKYLPQGFRSKIDDCLTKYQKSFGMEFPQDEATLDDSKK